MIATAEVSLHEIAPRYRPMQVGVSTAMSCDPEQFVTTETELFQSPASESAVAPLLGQAGFNQRPFTLGWESAVRYLTQDFADLVSRHSVSHLLPIHSPEDEPRLAQHWRALLDAFTQRVPPIVEDEELLDWDATITPVERAPKVVYASVRYLGRPKPEPIEDPWD